MIGRWNNDGIIFAVLPQCLKLGDNPSPFNTGSFPVFQGSEEITAAFEGTPSAEEGYYNGYLATFNDGGYGLLANWMPDIPANSEYTILTFLQNLGIGYGSDILNHLYSTYQGSLPIDQRANISHITVNSINRTIAGVAYLIGGNNQSTRYFYDDAVSPQINGTFTQVKNASGVYLYRNNQLMFGQEPYITPDIIQSELAYPWLGMYIGGYSPGNGGYNNIGAFLVYNRALTADEIAEINLLGPTLGGLRGYDNGDGSLELIDPNASNDPPQQTEMNAKFNLVQNTTDIQNNIVKIKNPHIAPSGNVVGQKEDYLFNY